MDYPLLFVETGSWLSSRKVLISPISLGKPNWPARQLLTSLTRQQVEDSPDIDTDKPVTRQHEATLLAHYDYPCYWNSDGLSDQVTQAKVSLDHELRSSKAIMTYHIQATDGDIGHVQGFLVDDETWSIRYMIVDTSNWWIGHRVLIAPQWICDVAWAGSKVSVDLTRDAVQRSPPYSSASQVDRGEEMGIYRHYERRGYWVDEVRRSTLEPRI